MERDREVEARELRYEQRTFEIQAARALMAVQVLDGHNRLLEHLLVQERRKKTVIGRSASAVIARTRRLRSLTHGFWGKYHPGAQPVPGAQTLTNNMDYVDRQHMLDVH